MNSDLPSVSELLHQLESLHRLQQGAGPPPLELRVLELARLLEVRLERLMSQPQRGEDLLQQGALPNLDLFRPETTPFDQRMLEDHTLLQEEMRLWRQGLQEIAALLKPGAQGVTPPAVLAHHWLRELEAWLQQAGFGPPQGQGDERADV